MNLVTLSLHSTVVSKLIRNSRLVRIVAMHFETLPKFLRFYTITDLKHQAHVHTGRWRAETKGFGPNKSKAKQPYTESSKNQVQNKSNMASDFLILSPSSPSSSDKQSSAQI